MLAALIRWSIRNRILVLMATALLTARSARNALYSRSMRYPICPDTQVIVSHRIPRASTAGRRGSGDLSPHHDAAVVPGARTVRGYSFFGDSYVYIIFDDKTDLYWSAITGA